MQIAVTSQNFRSVTGHGGKSRRFLIYFADGTSPPKEVSRLDLPKEMSLHAYHGDDHPLYGLQLDALITGSCGEGFVRRLGAKGIAVYATAETDPVAAVAALAEGRPLPAAAPHTH